MKGYLKETFHNPLHIPIPSKYPTKPKVKCEDCKIRRGCEIRKYHEQHPGEKWDGWTPFDSILVCEGEGLH